jgi:hypothetical protein
MGTSWTKTFSYKVAIRSLFHDGAPVGAPLLVAGGDGVG